MPYDADGLVFLTAKDLRAFGEADGAADDGRRALRDLGAWMAAYVQSAHPELGRAGDVCPFTRQAGRLDTLRFAASQAGPRDLERIVDQIGMTFEAFDAIECAKGQRMFRAVVVAFPQCQSPEGISALRQAQARFRLRAVRSGRMIALFHPDTEDPGLWNEDFRPLRSPMPLFVIRQLVTQDAPFAIKHPLLLPKYLLEFPIQGTKRIVGILRGRLTRTPKRAAG